MKGKVLVAGGYGEVGKQVVRILAQMDYQVIVGGRHRAKAEEFINSLEMKSRVRYRFFDLSHDRDIWNLMLEDEGIDLVIMCVKQENTEFVKTCFQKGIHYIDVTAEDAFLQSIEALHSDAQKNNSTAILSVGLAPGLTNLLARDSMSEVKNVDQLEIAVLLGIGDMHGAQAIRWTLETLLSGDLAEKSRRINYGSPWNERVSHPFDFSDQHALMRTTSLSRVKTFLCFSSKFLTALVFMLRHPWLRPLTRFISKNLSTKMVIKWGRDKGYAIQTQAFFQGTPISGSARLLTGENESLVTGACAAIVADRILSRSMSVGVFHIHQVMELSDILGPVQRFSGCKLGNFNGTSYL